MCGRFTLGKKPRELQQDFPRYPLSFPLAPRYNIAPTQPVFAWLADPEIRPELFTWGLVPHWARDPGIGVKCINARAETLPEKPAFQKSLRRKRCLIPADGWYEWRTSRNAPRQPMYFHRHDHRTFAFAGLWDEWHDPSGGLILSCTIITTRPNALARKIHPRMPAILRNEDHAAWLSPLETDPRRLRQMLEPVASDDFAVHPVSTAVNRTANDTPALIHPLSKPPPVQQELF